MCRAMVGCGAVVRVAQLDYLEQVAWALEALGRTASTTPIGKSGKDADRPQLAACLDYLDYLRPGYTLAVPSLDRLSRSRPTDRHRHRCAGTGSGSRARMRHWLPPPPAAGWSSTSSPRSPSSSAS
jgi:hypothetical protein